VDIHVRPFALDAQGNLLRIHNLYGVAVTMVATLPQPLW
jgi:hypothetical protein